MRTILKARWWIISLWLVAAVALVIIAPNLSELVQTKGTITVPDGYSSTEAQTILHKVAESNGTAGESSIALVFHNAEGLTADNKQEIEQAIERLNSDKDKLHIDSILEPFSQSALKEQLVSSDGKTILTSIKLKVGDSNVTDIQDELKQELSSVKVEHYITGQDSINHDTILSSQEGLKKSEYITVVFILLILILVFRSIIAPFIPLLAVGISYVISQTIVAFLADSYNFPLSTFTQIFMVAVLFGVGTDYCILLISRFKEQLSEDDDRWEAIMKTYRTAGKTVLFSGLAVLVGFAVIGFSQFILFRSAVAVAIGIAVMLLALFTIVPFFMAVLGDKLFWPSKGALEHKDSKLWGTVGTFALKRSGAALLIVTAIVAPLLLTYDGDLSYNSLDEISDKYNSVKAFNIISDSFEPGESLPTKIVIQSDKAVDEKDSVIMAEKISRELEKVNGVSTVRSLSRPTGDEIDNFKIATQVGTVSEGVSKSNEGLDKIRVGLSEASSSLTKNEPQLKEAASSTAELSKGTESVKLGVNELGKGLSKIEKGMNDGSIGAAQLKSALGQVKESAGQLSDANKQLLSTYQTIGKGLSVLDQGLEQMKKQLNSASQVLAGLNRNFSSLESKYPELMKDEDYLTIKGVVSQSSSGTDQMAKSLEQINTQLNTAASGIQQANNGYSQAAAGLTALSGGLDKIIQGISSLETGLSQAARGQSQIIAKVPSIVKGLDQLEGGQKQIQTGFEQLSGQISQLTTGLDQSVDGISQVSGGLNSVHDYLTQVKTSSDQQLGGWFVPNEVLKNEDFKAAFDEYLSADRTVMTLNVVFSDNPYGNSTIREIPNVKEAVHRAVEGTDFENAKVAVSGITSTFADLKQISNEDYTRTVIFMLAGIFMILIILLRSIVMPIYLVASLVLTYYTALAVTEIVFVNILGYSGITWTTPFFGFVMLVALGVDYSIFLMDRFNENRHMDVREAILHAMRKMGTVIFSAVIILGGTFASFYPSGVLSMLQIATVVLSGLVLYAILFLPFFVPVMVKMFGVNNWWPFRPKQSAHEVNRTRVI